MASTKEFLDYILGQLNLPEQVSYRKMMGEYVLYYKGKIIGDICDNRLLIKPTDSALTIIQNPVFEPPYTGAKNMLLIEDTDNSELLCRLINEIYDELPFPKAKKKAEGKKKND